jgi:hypothetical protein
MLNGGRTGPSETCLAEEVCSFTVLTFKEITVIQRKTAYELSESQVATPHKIVTLFWRLASKRRKQLGAVLDMGAGDCRFARAGHFERYVGIEIDRARAKAATTPENGQIMTGCAFRHRALNYDACIGNPPYVRHHDIESPWKEETVDRIERDLGIKLNKHCNLYLYFFCLGLAKAQDNGLLALVIPYEWVSRPSAKPVRQYIVQNRWNVDVYRFKTPIFDNVLTTASISIIDKSKRDGRWRYFEIDSKYKIRRCASITESKKGVLNYSSRGEIWALRGLSPGTQKVFTLTEGERIHNGLSRRDVLPCVTSLKHISRSIKVLSWPVFEKHFVNAGLRCWLIKSHKNKRSAALNAYLDSVPKKIRDTYTCRNQTPWYNYAPHPIPQLLVNSAFTKFGPKVLINSVQAGAVGSVLGIHSKRALAARQIQSYLLGLNFEKRLVAHAKVLKKIEVKQMNAVLEKMAKLKNSYARQ